MSSYTPRGSNFGVYLTLALFGAGLGLLIGSYLYSRKQLEFDFEEVEDLEEESEDEEPMAKKKNYKKTPISSQETRPVVDKTKRIKKNEIGSSGEETAVEEKFRELAEVYHMTLFQRGLVESGMISLEDLEAELVSSFADDSEKPALDDLYPMNDDIIEETWEKFVISSEAPDPSLRKNMIELVYDPPTDSLAKLRQGRPVPTGNKYSILPEDAFDTAMDIADATEKPVYIYDVERSIQYKLTFTAAPRPVKEPVKKSRKKKKEDDDKEQ